MTQTVAGPEALTPTQADLDAAARRLVVQSCYHEGDRTATMNDMVKFGVTAKELQGAMDYKMDAIAWMREQRFPDGFQGLKVWPDKDLETYYKWQAVTPNALSIEGIKPSYSQVQEILDREARLKVITEGYKSPWER